VLQCDESVVCLRTFEDFTITELFCYIAWASIIGGIIIGLRRSK
jgi:hypothetical protein